MVQAEPAESSFKPKKKAKAKAKAPAEAKEPTEVVPSETPSMEDIFGPDSCETPAKNPPAKRPAAKVSSKAKATPKSKSEAKSTSKAKASGTKRPAAALEGEDTGGASRFTI